MGTFVMVKDACPDCGETARVELLHKKEPILCWYVKCGRCGRETAKHREAEHAVRDWNGLPREDTDEQET